MKPRISREDLPEIVAEAERLQARERESLQQEEAAEVLRELDVSPEHLPEAQRLVVERRLARKQKRRRLLAAAAVIAFAIAGFMTARSRVEREARVQASSAVVELAGKPISGPVLREADSLLSFEVVLDHPPMGEQFQLECSWRDPGGNERYVKRWRTARITHDKWPTHCRHAFDTRDESGSWTVVMRARGGDLASAEFELK